MKLTVFQADKGDCLLLTGADETRVLIDGGLAGSYSKHVAARLGEIREAGGRLDVVYVSHIDDDHISGVLQLLEDEVAWRVHEYQLGTGNRDHEPPAVARPPEVEEIWHNAFREQLEANSGPIEEMLAASAAVLKAGRRAEHKELAATYQNLAEGVSSAIELARRVSPEQLGIPVNTPFQGKLGVLGTKPRVNTRGSLRFSLLGPRKEDLEDLREEWNDWLKANQEALARLRLRMAADIERLGANEVEVLRRSLELQASELGARSRVTTPNLASLMFVVEEAGKRVLLTGDGHAREILSGLEHARKLKPGRKIHVDVLKVQHHGSEFNIDEEFCRRVTADHYLFCANGEHANPDPRVLTLILDSRLGSEDAAPDASAAGAFKFWFNSSAKTEGGDAEHMEQVERLVKERAKQSDGRFSASFLEKHYFDLEV